MRFVSCIRNQWSSLIENHHFVIIIINRQKCLQVLWAAYSTLSSQTYGKLWNFKGKTLPKAQRTRGLSGSYTNLNQISSSESRPSTNFKISTKHQPFDKTYTNLQILTKPSLRILTKIELHNHNQASVAK